MASKKKRSKKHFLSNNKLKGLKYRQKSIAKDVGIRVFFPHSTPKITVIARRKCLCSWSLTIALSLCFCLSNPVTWIPDILSLSGVTNSTKPFIKISLKLGKHFPFNKNLYQSCLSLHVLNLQGQNTKQFFFFSLHFFFPPKTSSPRWKNNRFIWTPEIQGLTVPELLKWCN